MALQSWRASVSLREPRLRPTMNTTLRTTQLKLNTTMNSSSPVVTAKMLKERSHWPLSR